jgi:signal transduction histidine kinase
MDVADPRTKNPGADLGITLLAATLVLLIGWVDYRTGEELSISVLYLVPVCLSTWRVGRWAGLVIGWASAIAWLVADRAASVGQGQLLVPYWNAAVLLAFFWVVVYLLSAMRTLQAGLEAKVEQRTSALQAEIAERKRAEDLLVRANQDLSQRREELVQALSDLHKMQLQLIEAAKLETIGRLAAGVAHEVKNPLMTMTMVADYLGQVLPSNEPDAAAMLQDLRDAIGRANRVISELLELSRPAEVTLRPEDLHAVIDRSLSLVKLEWTRRHIDVVRQFCQGLPLLPLDRNKIEQVFVNVFMNAIQAMSEGGTLAVRTFGPQPGQGGCRRVRVEVDDTGPGIPDAVLGKVFDPFFTTKPVGQGTGLGLGVARQIINLHEGTLELANRPEGGVRVTLMLGAGEGTNHEQEADLGDRR